jgi:hypothetical protein
LLAEVVNEVRAGPFQQMLAGPLMGFMTGAWAWARLNKTRRVKTKKLLFFMKKWVNK